MHNTASVLKNETHKLFWDFEIQTDPPLSARRPDLIIVKKRKRIGRIVDLAVPADDRVKMKEGEKKDKYQDLAVEHESGIYNNCNRCSWYNHQMINKETRGFGNNQTSGDYPNYCIMEISQNTEKSPGDLLLLKLR